MKCNRCGSDALIKKDEWYKCANCGAVMFDTSIEVNHIVSPTMRVEEIDSQRTPSQDIVTYNPNEKEQEKPAKSKRMEIIEFFIPIVTALIIAIVLKTFVFANAVVPTGSMLNTIHENDRIIASRLAYLNSEPERYDIAIFYYPDDEKQRFVKRVIGLPGETVEIIGGIVYVTTVNGEQIQLDSSFVTNCRPTGDFGPYQVPEDSYFMLGDNRESSWDSRYWNNKYVHKSKIIGKVMFRYYPNISSID